MANAAVRVHTRFNFTSPLANFLRSQPLSPQSLQNSTVIHVLALLGRLPFLPPPPASYVPRCCPLFLGDLPCTRPPCSSLHTGRTTELGHAGSRPSPQIPFGHGTIPPHKTDFQRGIRARQRHYVVHSIPLFRARVHQDGVPRCIHACLDPYCLFRHDPSAFTAAPRPPQSPSLGVAAGGLDPRMKRWQDQCGAPVWSAFGRCRAEPCAALSSRREALTPPPPQLAWQMDA
mmetsp:Transcript_2596/g.6344  ORF Transcript_2596/g.6344 Transcript_2596/m.6344 type:complete len:231 (-) Transcript_2596:201-893(-)